jgi:hypothetical protein
MEENMKDVDAILVGANKMMNIINVDDVPSCAFSFLDYE